MTTQTIFLTAGATSKTVDLFLVQNAGATSPGNPITGLAFNTSSFTAYYRAGATGTLTSITLATQTVGGAYSSGGFVEVSSTNAPGQYRFDIPNAVIATAGEANIIFNGATNLATHMLKIIITAVDLYDTVRAGLTALPNVASGNAGALLTAGTGTAQLSVTGGRGNADVVYWNGSVLTGGTGGVPEFAIVDRGTAQAATGTTLQLRSAAAFATSELIGAVVYIVSATTGAGQSRVITAYNGGTDTATVDTWTTTPTGTIVYIVFASPPASSTLLPPVNTTQINGTNQTARDLGASVLLSAGTGTGQLDFTSGVVKSNVVQSGGSTCPAGAIPNAVAGAAGGLFIAGTNAATTVTTSFTTTFTGNLTGSIGSLGTTAKTDVSTAVLTTQMTESYAADGVAPTLAQAAFLTMQSVGEVSVSGTTLTVKKLDGSTTAATYTLDSSTAPTSRTRAT